MSSSQCSEQNEAGRRLLGELTLVTTWMQQHQLMMDCSKVSLKLQIIGNLNQRRIVAKTMEILRLKIIPKLFCHFGQKL